MSQYGAYTLHAGLARLCTYMHADAHVPGQACTYRPTCNTALTQQQWFCEHASMLCYTYTAYLVLYSYGQRLRLEL